MDRERQSLDNLLKDVTNGLAGMLAFRDQVREAPQLCELREGIIAMLRGNESARKSYKGYFESVSSIKGMSQALNEAATRHEETIRQIVRILVRTETALKGVIETIDGRVVELAPTSEIG